jgi:dGTPase
MLSAQVYDVIEATQAALAAHAVTGLDAVRAAPPLVVFSPAMGAGTRVLKAFLMRALYRHPTVVHKMDAARLVVADLFAAYLAAPQEMAAPYSDAQASPVRCLQRRVADYVAGMTDRFALREHARLTGRQALV